MEAHDLVKVFPRGNVRALDGVSLEVEAGTVLGLLGPNGAGKTTAVRILSTILGPDSGTPRSSATTWSTQADAVRRIIGLAGQYAAVDENLTGRENIHMVARLSHLSRKVAARRADELLEEFGLADAGDRVLKTYSGGMRRRLDLAAALVATRRSSSSTSRPPGWTRRAARACGPPSRSWCARARRCCSPPSTSRRPTGWPATSW